MTSQPPGTDPVGPAEEPATTGKPPTPAPSPPAPSSATPSRPAPAWRQWLTRGAVLIAAAVAAVLLYYVLAALIPRWWAQTVGRQVDGRLGRGIVWGLLYGVVFTFLPVLVLAQVRHRRLEWPYKIGVAVAAIALATPNLLTLSVALGASRASQAADRVMDVQAPGFRYATLWGVIIGALVGIAVVAVSMLFHRRGEEIRNLRARLEARERH